MPEGDFEHELDVLEYVHFEHALRRCCHPAIQIFQQVKNSSFLELNIWHEWNGLP